jgi:hypothetical protein
VRHRYLLPPGAAWGGDAALSDGEVAVEMRYEKRGMAQCPPPSP